MPLAVRYIQVRHEQMKLYQNGFVNAIGGGGNPYPPARGECVGWSAGVVRRNMQKLLSIDFNKCSGFSYFVTLTLRDCPESAADFAVLIDRFIKWLRRRGLVRYHYVIEWQKRGVPHLHMAVWLDARLCGDAVAVYWVESAAAAYFPNKITGIKHATKTDEINGGVGWAKYVSKYAGHAARGFYNSQRRAMPKGWERSGRMWSVGGDWQGLFIDADDLPINDKQQYALRRIIWRMRYAAARDNLRRFFVENGSWAYVAARRGAPCSRSGIKTGLLLSSIITVQGSYTNWKVKEITLWELVQEHRRLVGMLQSARRFGSVSKRQHDSEGRQLTPGDLYFTKAGKERRALSHERASMRRVNFSVFMNKENIARVVRYLFNTDLYDLD